MIKKHHAYQIILQIILLEFIYHKYISLKIFITINIAFSKMIKLVLLEKMELDKLSRLFLKKTDILNAKSFLIRKISEITVTNVKP